MGSVLTTIAIGVAGAGAVALGKKIFGSGKRGSESTGATESYDERSAGVNETYKLQQALSEFREDTREKSNKFENDIIKESREAIDVLIADVKKYNKIRYGGNALNVNISQMEREQRKTEDEIHGFIVGKVSKRISLDDEECKSILKLDAGRNKTKKMNEFYKKVLIEAMTDLKKLLRDSMKSQTIIVEDHIVSRMNTITYTVTGKTNEFNNIKDIKDTDESKMEQEQIRLSYLISLCDKTLNIIDT